MPFSVPISGFLTATATVNALAFKRNRLKLRGLAIVALLIFVWNFYHIPREFTNNALWNASVTMIIWIYCLKIFDDLCLSRVSFGHCRYPSPPKRCGIPGAVQDHGHGLDDGNLRWAIEFMGNLRGIGTKWTIDRVQPFIFHTGGLSPRLYHLGWSFCNIFTCYLILEIVARLIIPVPKTAVHLVSADKEHLFSRRADVTTEELKFRVFYLMFTWFTIMLTIRMLYFLAAFIVLSLGFQDVRAWPDVFYYWPETYSLRIFWGYVNFPLLMVGYGLSFESASFNQAMRRPLISISGFVVHGILRLRKRNILARDLKLVCCFSISAFVGMQTVAAMDGSPFHQHTSVARFFLTQAAGITIEDAGQEIWGNIFGTQPAQWKSFLGMAWTVAFLYWTSPGLVYPVARMLSAREDVLAPFSIFNNWDAVTDCVKPH